MNEPVIRQFFGPSARHERACVEASFAAGESLVSPAKIQPLLANHGFKPSAPLPAEARPIESAICSLARAMLAPLGDYPLEHGTQDGRSWVALSFPVPTIAARVLEVAFGFAHADGVVSPELADKARHLAHWVGRVMKTAIRVRTAADLLGLDIAQVNLAADIYQIGQGTRGLHFNQAGNQRDAMTGTILENNKHITVQWLARMGLPTTRAIAVRQAQDAAEAATRIGFPCVVKPVSMCSGAGVETQLRTVPEVVAAVERAQASSRGSVLIENHVEGDDHRLTVSGDELLFAYRRRPASVTGDGKSTLGQLIDAENLRRAQSQGPENAYRYPIRVDQELERFLAERYDLTLASVLEGEQRIALSGPSNVARGGTLDNVIDRVHPDNRALAIRVSRLFRVRTIGIDIMTRDIARSWKEGGCAIIEVNRFPGSAGIGDAVLLLRTLFPRRLSGRVPTLAIVGGPDFRSRAADCIGRACAEAGLQLAAATYAEHTVPRRPAISPSVLARPVETLILDPEADAIMALCEPDQIEATGFPFRRCDLLVAEDGERFAWLAELAGAVFTAGTREAELAEAVRDLAERYADPDEGGPLPVLEPLPSDAGDAIRFKIWRARAMPRRWFWREVGLERPDAAGQATLGDLLDAVRTLADWALRSQGEEGLPAPFIHGERVADWAMITVEASIALPERNADLARAALLDAAARVNRICSAKIA